jgi:rhamnose utilization protein RhaD (predicted bifunctional aldolase and dehydrogenase)
MKSLYSEERAKACQNDLDLRVYTSNLLGQSDDLVLHGGGNTSVKSTVDGEELLLVKGSGWDLASIKPAGFAPVKMDALLEMAQLARLSDQEMVSGQKAAMTDKTAPNPSVEAILHALIPYKFVDHTHADAVVTISNSTGGADRIAALYPDFLIVPYVMPGFVLAQKIHEMTRDINWDDLGGIILLHHGIFTFDEDAKRAYEKMIEAVTRAEAYLDTHAPLTLAPSRPTREFDLKALTNALSDAKGYAVHCECDQSDLALTYAAMENLSQRATRGVLTPEHIIRTKRAPLILKEGEAIAPALAAYGQAYRDYFEQHAQEEIMLNPAPNYVVIAGYGVLSCGKDAKEAGVIRDIVAHTMRAVLRADQLGGYESLALEESFAMEYWELEQAKLRRQ